MRIFKYSIILVLLTGNSLLGLSQEQKNKKLDELGIFFGIGSSYDSWGANANTYTKNRYQIMPEFGTYYGRSFPNSKYSIKAEYASRFLNSDCVIGTNTSAIASQSNMGVNLKLGRSFFDSDAGTFNFYVGPGIYTVNQKRVAYISSISTSINDGTTAYWGMSVEFEMAASFNVGEKKMGFASRIFFQPPLTLASKKNVPKFYHSGFSIAWFYAL